MKTGKLMVAYWHMTEAERTREDVGRKMMSLLRDKRWNLAIQAIPALTQAHENVRQRTEAYQALKGGEQARVGG